MMNDENMINNDFIEDGEIIDIEILEVDNPTRLTSTTTDVIDVDDIDIYTIDTQEAFNALGEPNEDLKHTLLTDRNLPEQHEITAITGLREELDSIEALQTVYSNEKGYAEYYYWADGGSQNENRVGYFVTFDYSNDMSITRIKFCTDGDVYGVTTATAAFVGGQDDAPRDYRYGLVAHSGLVAVRCEVDVEVGDYVTSNQFGCAKKSNSDCGYKVYAIENIYGVYYAVIDLKVPVGKLHNMANSLIDLDGRVEKSEALILATLNVANEAYNKADKATQISDDAIKNALESLKIVGGVADDVDGLKGDVAMSNTLAIQAKAIADNTMLSAEALRKEAVEKATEALEDATKLRKEFEQQAEQMDEALRNTGDKLVQVEIDMQNKLNEVVDDFNNASVDLEGIRDELEEMIEVELEGTKEELQSELQGSIKNLEDNVDNINQEIEKVKNDLENTSIDMAGIEDDLLNWVDNLDTSINDTKTDLQNSIDEISNTADELAGDLQATSSSLSDLKDELIPLSQWSEGPDKPSGVAGFVAKANEGSSILATMASHIIGYHIIEEVATLEDWNSKIDKNENNIYYCIGNNSYYYYGKDDKNDGQDKWRRKAGISIVFQYAKLDQSVVYYTETRQRYWYYKDQWLETQSPLDAGLSETFVGVRQLAEENKAQFDAIAEYNDGDNNVLAGVMNYVDKHSAEINQIASLNKDVVGLKGRVDDNEAAISLVTKYTNNTYITVDTWNEDEHKDDTDIIYYVKNEDKYYYYKDDGWKDTIDPTTAGLSSAIVGIKQASDANKAELDIIANYEKDDQKGLAALKAQVEENKADLSLLTGIDGGLAGLKAKVDKNTAKIETFAKLEGDFGESLAGFVEEVTEENAQIQALASYNNGASGLIGQVNENSASISTIASKTIGYETVEIWDGVNDNRIENKIYYNTQDDAHRVYSCKVGSEWIERNDWSALANLSDGIISQSKVYYVRRSQPKTSIYWYYGNKDGVDQWINTELPSEAGLGETIAGIKQIADNNKSELDAVAIYKYTDNNGVTHDSLAGLMMQVEENKADISALTGIDDSLAGLIAQANENVAKVTTFASHIVGDYITVDTWDADKHQEDTINIYYNKDTEKYYYQGEKESWDAVNPTKGNVYYVVFLRKYWYYGNEDGVDKWILTDKSYKAGLKGSVAGVQETADKNSASIESLVKWKGDAGESLAGFVAEATAENAEIKALATYNGGATGLIGKVDAHESTLSTVVSRTIGYEVVQTWYEGAPTDKFYYSSSDPSYPYQYWGVDKWIFTGGFLKLDNAKLVSRDKVYCVPQFNPSKYWYYNEEEQSWESTESLSDVGLGETLAGIKASVDDNKAELDAVATYTKDDKTGLAGLVAQVTENTGNVAAITKIEGDIAGLRADVTDNSAKVTTLASHTIGDYEMIDVWSEEDAIEGKIYYVVKTGEYYYYENQKWESTDKPYKAGLESVTAGIQQTADENSASISELVTWKGGTISAIAGLRTDIDKNSAKVSTLATHLIGEYTSVDVWSETDKKTNIIYYAEDTKKYYYHNGVGWESTDKPYKAGLMGTVATVQQTADNNTASIDMLASKTIGYETVETWDGEFTRDPSKVYYYAAIDQPYSAFDGTTWCKKAVWKELARFTVISEDKIYYVPQRNPAIYWYYDNGWKDTTSPSEAGLGQTLAGIKEIADESKAELDAMASYDGGDGTQALAGITAYVDKNSAHLSQLAKYSNQDSGNSGVAGLISDVNDTTSNLSLLTGFNGGISGLVSQVTNNTSRVDTIAKHISGEYVIIPEWTSQHKKDNDTANQAKIYYDKDDELYYYYNPNSKNWDKSTTWNAFGPEPDKVYYIVGLKQYRYCKNDTWITTSDAYEAGLPSAIAGIQVESDDNSSQINQLTSWQGETATTMAEIQTKAEDAEASIELMVSSIDKYSVGEFSQAYGLDAGQAHSILPKDIVYIPTVSHQEEMSDGKAPFRHDEDYRYNIRVGSISQSNLSALPYGDTGDYYLGNGSLIDNNDSFKTKDKYCILFTDDYIKIYTTGDPENTENNTYKVYLLYYKNNNSTSITEIIPAQTNNITTKYQFTKSANYNYYQLESKYLVAGSSQQFSRYRYYTWNGRQWQESAHQGVAFSKIKPSENDVLKYWYTDTDEPPQGYEAYALYIWDADKEYWKKVNVLGGNVTNRAISMIRQTTNSIALEVTNARGDVVSLTERIGENENNLRTLASWATGSDGKQYNLASISQTANTAGASISQVVSAIGKNGKVNASSIVQSINDSGSSITIEAAHINLSGFVSANETFTIDKDGYITATGGTIGSWIIKDRKIYSGGFTDEKGNTYPTAVIQVAEKNSVVFATGGSSHSDYSDCPFRVKSDGSLYATKGKIGTWEINEEYLGYWSGAVGSTYFLSRIGKSAWVANAPPLNTTKPQYRNCLAYFTGKFAVDTDGTLYASNAYISGKITATSGEIGGWTITSPRLEYKTSSYWTLFHPGGVSLTCQDGAVRTLTIGVGTPSAMNFGVTASGQMFATAGTIGGWQINSTYFGTSVGNKAFYIASASDNIAYWIRAHDTNGNRTFGVSRDGGLFATKGTIGGWTINQNSLGLKANSSTYGYFYLSPTGTSLYVPMVGAAVSCACYLGGYFAVSTGGTLYAQNAYISGKIEATSGSFSRDVTVGGRSISNWINSTGYVYNINATHGTIGGVNIDQNNGLYIGSRTFFSNNTMANKAGVFIGTQSLTGSGSDGGISLGTYNNGSGIYYEQFLYAGRNVILGWNGNGYYKTVTAASRTAYYYSSNSVNVADTNMTQVARLDVGTTGVHLWGTWFVGNAQAVTSDRNKKNTITLIDNKYENLFDKLSACTYKYNDGTSNRLHTGFIAQEVKDALDDAGIDTIEFAGITITKNDDGTEDWGLRYDEFVALNTWQIQKLKSRVAMLEQELKELKSQLEV